MSAEPRIQLADVKADIEKAFEGGISSLDDDETADPENLGDEAKDLNASHARITRFLKQSESERAENERLRSELAEMTARAERAEGEAKVYGDELDKGDMAALEMAQGWHDATVERDKFRAALQSIADYRSARIGTEAWGLTASYCQTTARAALAVHKGGSTT